MYIYIYIYVYIYVYIYIYISPWGGAGRLSGLCAFSCIEWIRGTLRGAKPFRHFLPVGAEDM